MASKGFERVSSGENTHGLNKADFQHEIDVSDYGPTAPFLNPIYTSKRFETIAAPGSDQLLWAVLHAFDVLGVGWIVCDSNGLVLGLNQTAETLTANHDGLDLDGEGRLQNVFGESGSLVGAVSRVTGMGDSRLSETNDITLSIARPGKCCLTVLVHPVRRSMQNESERPLALLLTLDLSMHAVSPAELQNLFQLTPSESRFALLLMEGRTLDDCYDEIQIDIPTGRFHLRELYRKTRSQNRSELVLALFRSIAMIHLATVPPSTNSSRKPLRVRSLQ